MLANNYQTRAAAGTGAGTGEDTVRQTQEFLLFPESSQLYPAAEAAEPAAEPAAEQDIFPSQALPPTFDPTTESWLHRLEGIVGQVIDGRYRIIRLLGVGGMGAVYEVEHLEIGRRMAMKILHSILVGHAITVTRFRAEARAVMRINHPNVVEITDAGITEDGQVFFVMELLRGAILAQVIEDHPRVPVPQALHIILQICRALQVAHSAGIVHRDLKPGNIILTQPQGHPDLVKIFDFGIAKNMLPSSCQPPLTSPGVAMGTPCYMAPEQVVGQPVDHKIDIYAAGTLLYEMLTGRLPHEGKTVMQLLRRKISLPPTSPRVYLPELSVDLERVILRALATQADERFQTMAEFADALEVVASAELSSSPVREDDTDPRVEETTRRIVVEEPTLVVSRRRLLIQRQARASRAVDADAPVKVTLHQAAGPVSEGRSPRMRRLVFGLISVSALALASPSPPARETRPGGPVLSSLTAERVATPQVQPRVSQLLEWAKYAAQGGRLVHPQGDNVFDLLERVEIMAPRNPAAAALRKGLCGKLEHQISLAILGRQYGEAVNLIHAWSMFDPGDPRLGRSLLRLNLLQGRDALNGGDPQHALSFVQEAQGLVQQDPRIDELMGDIYEVRLEHAQALRYYQRALEGAGTERARRLRRKIKDKIKERKGRGATRRKSKGGKRRRATRR